MAVLALKWFRFQPVTCAAMLIVVVVLAILNVRCHLFFAPGSTTRLTFGHGWPLHFQEGGVPGPGLLEPNPDGILPNYIWGFPEVNDDPKIMAQYEARLAALPRTPWGLRQFARRDVMGLVFDLLIAFAMLAAVSFFCEIVCVSIKRRVENLYCIGGFLSLLIVSAAGVSFFVADSWMYVLPTFLPIVGSVFITATLLSKGHQE